MSANDPGIAQGRPGLHAERTALAWQRTALALLVAVLAVGRLVLADLPLLGLALGACAIPMAWALIFLASGTRRSLLDGRPPALTAAVVLVVGLAELGHLAIS